MMLFIRTDTEELRLEAEPWQRSSDGLLLCGFFFYLNLTSSINSSSAPQTSHYGITLHVCRPLDSCSDCI